MTTRILRIELRRSTALWAALVIAAVGVFVLFASNPPYDAWMHLVIVQREILQLTWPLALAAGAWQGMRERRSRVEELWATTSRPRWQRVLPVATAMAIGAVAAYLVMLAGAAGHLRHIDSYFPTGAVPLIALGALAMVGAVWLGLAIGVFLPYPLTAPMLAVVGFFGLALSPMLRGGVPGTLLLFPYLQGPRDGGYALRILSTRANLSQALWLAAVAAAGLALFAAARPRTRIAALLPVVLGAAIAVPMMPRLLADAWVEDTRATELVCTPEPRVCIARVHARALDTLREPAREALAILAAKLPPAPTQVVFGDASEDLIRRLSEVPGARAADTLLIELGFIDDLTSTSHDALVRRMLDGAGVPACPDLVGKADEPDERYLAARAIVAAWLLDSALPGSGRSTGGKIPFEQQVLADLRSLPADEQRARVGAFRDAERACVGGDRIELLTGPSR